MGAEKAKNTLIAELRNKISKFLAEQKRGTNKNDSLIIFMILAWGIIHIKDKVVDRKRAEQQSSSRKQQDAENEDRAKKWVESMREIKRLIDSNQPPTIYASETHQGKELTDEELKEALAKILAEKLNIRFEEAITLLDYCKDNLSMYMLEKHNIKDFLDYCKDNLCICWKNTTLKTLKP